MFDPRSPYQRRMWHYESDRPLSVAQLVALGSLDAQTAALLWLLIERHTPLIVSGPTDPTPGVGKTTTLNALLGFLPVGSTLVYTMGMYEDFSFVSEVEAESTCVLANEVSDHLRIYMWGRAARQLLRLPEQQFAIATSCHADTIDDVMSMLTDDLRLDAEVVRRLGLVINIGLVGRRWPQQRRFLTVHYIRPTAQREDAIELLQLAHWDAASDTFAHADATTLAELARLKDMTPEEFQAALDRRITILEPLTQGRGASVAAFREAVDDLYAQEHGIPRAAQAGGDEDDEDDEDETSDDEAEDDEDF